MKITDENVKKRLDVYVSEALGVTRSSAQGMIDEGLVTVCGKVESKNYRLRQGDEVEIEEQEPKELNVEAENIPLDIVYEDENILLADKKSRFIFHLAPVRRVRVLKIMGK